MQLAGDGIEVLGMVDDLRDLFDRARVFVCPLRVGAGVKGKITSALSYGVPIVSTSVGVEGAGLTEGVHVLVADESNDFVAKTLKLYNDEALWNKMSFSGQELVRTQFSTGMGSRVLSNAIARAHEHRLGVSMPK
jgi:glycosyltransferase involved in cell wall biosynthesis